MKTPPLYKTGTKKAMSTSRKAMVGKKSSKPAKSRVSEMGHEKRHAAHMSHVAAQCGKLGLSSGM
jgi:hypothetical protein